jgi:hypothetical protein
VVIRGYEYGRGQFVTFTAEELNAIDVESSKVIDLESLCRGAISIRSISTAHTTLYPDCSIAVETLRMIGAAMAKATYAKPASEQEGRTLPVKGAALTPPASRPRADPRDRLFRTRAGCSAPRKNRRSLGLHPAPRRSAGIARWPPLGKLTSARLCVEKDGVQPPM